MSRSGYVDDFDDQWASIRWRGAVTAAIRGQRGQKFFEELRDALEAMPQKRLIADSLRTEQGDVCALGALGAVRGVDLSSIDPEDAETVAEAFGIAEALAREVVYMNDEGFWVATPEERHSRMLEWVKSKLRTAEGGQ